MDPSFVASCPSAALSRLVDDTRDDYLPPRSLLPGEGLTGMFWAETKRPGWAGGSGRNGGLGQTTILGLGGPLSAAAQQRHVMRGLGGGGGVGSTQRVGESVGAGTGPRAPKRRRSSLLGPDEVPMKRASSTLSMPGGGCGGGSFASDVEEDDLSRSTVGSSRLHRKLTGRRLGRRNSNSSLMSLGNRWSSSRRFRSAEDDFGGGDGNDEPSSDNKLRWRDVTALAADPDQPPSPRLQLYAKAGIGYAAGVQFNVRGTRGLVVFMARKTVDAARLTSSSNASHLAAAADLIGSICAFAGPREQSLSERAAERDETKRRIKAKVMTLHAFKNLSGLSERVGGGESGGGGGAHTPGKGGQWRTGRGRVRWRSQDAISHAASRTKKSVMENTTLGNLRVWLRKCRGSDVEPPPPMPWCQALWTLFGSFVTFLTWSLMAEAVQVRNPSLRMMRGSFGSVVAAQFTLMAAPASQPRNAFLSQVLAGLICIPINYITFLPGWVRTSVSPSLLVTAMAKLGVTHPTAGGDALLYASTGEDVSQWQMWGFVLTNYAFAIVMATVINNLSRRRQYPIYWGYGFRYLRGRLRGITGDGSKKG